MAKQKTWKWSDGGVASVTYDGDGNGSAVFSSSVNEGTDKGIAISFTTSDKKASVTKILRQEGRREKFAVSDGDFILESDADFNVLKPTYE